MSFMRVAGMVTIAGAVALAAMTGPAQAQFRKGEKGWNKEKDKPQQTEVTRCAAPIGTVAVQEPENDWWTRYNLSNPERLIKYLAQSSNCLRVVDRGAGLAARAVERGLAESGEMRRGSNIGKGQVRTADYVIVPDMINADANSGGSAVGAIAGGLIGGVAGGLLGGMRTTRMEAQTTISLVNTRTTEVEFIAEGTASKRDMSFGAGGGFGGFAAAGGGYADTEIGKVITVAYIEAFNNLVAHMQGTQPGSAAAAAPQAALNVNRPTSLRSAAGASGRVVRTLERGEIVYPTGERSEGFVQVEDEFGDKGWVPTAAVSARAQ
jgi:curli biogenesis system outer membrane secretion channel CsgG